MLRRIVFLSCVAVLVLLATSSKAQAWGCYRYGGFGGYRAGFGYGGGVRYGGFGYGGFGYGGYGGYRAGYYRGW